MKEFNNKYIDVTNLENNSALRKIIKKEILKEFNDKYIDVTDFKKIANKFKDYLQKIINVETQYNEDSEILAAERLLKALNTANKKLKFY